MPPDDTGGAAILSYAIDIIGPDGPRSLGSFDTQAVVPDLVNGTPYQVRVAAVNSVGLGAWTAAADVTPFGPASAPLAFAATPGDGTAMLTWAAPELDGGRPVDSYVIEVSDVAGTREVASPGTSLLLSELLNGVPVALRVAAVTEAGPGAWSTSITLTPRAPRVSAPGDLTLTQRRLRVRATWSAPLRGEATSYLVAVSVNGRRWQTVATVRGTSYTLTPPSRTTPVRVKVAALDSYGRGPWSAVVAN